MDPMLGTPGQGRQDYFLQDYLPPAGPGMVPLRPCQCLTQRQVARDRRGGDAHLAGARNRVQPCAALYARRRAPPCLACEEQGAEHCS